MTVSSYANDWKLWMASASPTGYICDCLRFVFSDFTTIQIANKLTVRPTEQLTHEDGTIHRYTQCGFTVAPPDRKMTSEYEITITMQPVYNDLLNAVANLHTSQLSQTVNLQYRIYLLPSNPNRPAITPASKFSVSAITVTRDSVVVSCVPPMLSRKRSGQPYTIEEFNGLSPF